MKHKMIINKIFFLLLVIQFFACNKVKKDQQNVQSNIDNNNTNVKIELENKYTCLEIVNPDTALACFLFYNYSDYKPFEYQEQYQRLDLEFDNQIKLIKSLYNKEENLDEAILNIENIRNLFVQDIRESVYKDYKEYNGVSGMSFNFLLNRRDSVVKPLLYDLLRNKNAPDDEKEKAMIILLETFQDSTFIDFMK